MNANMSYSPQSLQAFDYVETKNGDLVCVMWTIRGMHDPVGYVFYTASRPNLSDHKKTLSGRLYWKSYYAKNRCIHDEYVQKKHEVIVVSDPVGGIMINVNSACILRHYNTRSSLKHLLELHPKLNNILDLLQVSNNSVGITGSTLLGGKHSDIDLVIYNSSEGRHAASIIKAYITECPNAWLEGYWGRKHHHRRFRVDNLDVCPKFPIPKEKISLSVNAVCLGIIGRLRATIISAKWGHCTPSLYNVCFTDGSKWFSTGDALVLYSSESAHSMAFNDGDQVIIERAILWREGKSQFLTIHMGDVNALRPR